MVAPSLSRLGLVIRSAPWQGRAGRDQVDMAIAAASLDIPLELFFVDHGITQLLNGRDPAPAGLPAAASAWTALPELGPVRFSVEAGRHRALSARGCGFCVDVEPVSADEMRARQSACDRLLVA